MTTCLPARHVEALTRAATTVLSCPPAVRTDVRALTTWLYLHWYTHLGSPKPAGWVSGVPFLTRLRQALSHAARGRGARSTEAVVARQQLDTQSGYWTMWSAAGPPGAGRLQRVYWNAVQSGTPALVHDLVATLPAATRWSFKTPLAAEHFLRPDTAVLYLEAGAWPRLRPLVASLGEAHRKALHPDVPPLTRWITHGLASAADPGVVGESFGLTLCRHVAETACARPADTSAVLMDALASRLFPEPAAGRRTHTKRRAARDHG